MTAPAASVHRSFCGIYTAIVTPFRGTGLSCTVDFESLERLLDFQYQSGVAGVVVGGSTGEVGSLSESEFKMVTEFVVNWCQDKLPVIAGIGIHPLARSIEVVEYLSTLNVAGLLVVTPPYQKPPQRGLIDFFVALKAKTHLPIVAYNVPGRTAVNLLPQTVADLALKKSIAALKDSSASIEQLIETVRLSPPSFPILSGEDGLIHPAIVSGACGAISATANIIPRQLVELEHAARSGDGERAAAIQRTVAPVIRAAFAESNPIAVKFGLYALGVISEATVRTPLAYASDETQRVVREALGV